jgi:hypothetical protein
VDPDQRTGFRGLVASATRWRGTSGCNASPNSFERYGIHVQHLSVAQTFSITERLRTTFTGAFSNLMKHPHFQNLNTNILLMTRKEILRRVLPESGVVAKWKQGTYLKARLTGRAGSS